MSDIPTLHPAGRKGAPVWTFVAAAALFALVQFVSLPAHPKILSVINNFAHGPVFGALALVFLAALRPRLASRPWMAYAGAFLLAAAAGLAIEALQIFTRRDASIADALTNAVGAGCFLCFAACFDRSLWLPETRSRGRRLALLAAVLQLFVLLMPVGHALLAYSVRMYRFPTIMQFTSTLDMYFIELRDCNATFVTSASTRLDHGSNRALRILFFGNDWPGISNLEPSPDWRRFHRLRIDVTNPGDSALLLGLRIHDIGRGQDYEDRFNRQFAIGAGTRHILDVRLEEIASAPADRQLDLSRIGGLVLFRLSPRTAQASEIILTRVWLE